MPNKIHNLEFKFFFVSEVAAMLRVSSAVVYCLIRDGKLPAVKVGRAWKIPEESITSYICALKNQ